ncbi:uncharacterized protein LOC129572356 [Sitodiplosis mosellana]|uniref:uncharacterized protein LOC129572356 n=1 Tax=Sitodiplosis mosellana TaxID=263140 RepID=UPI002444C4BB|nr:uncharacterized protein LOC129572356 [Sitodiplosis mosellana]
MENLFWTILESDLCVEIPTFIKNGFDYSNFGNALVFKEISDQHIDDLEKFIRYDIAKLVEIKNPEEFYGRIFAKDHEKFIFLPGERVLIKELVAHVKSIVDQNGKNTGLSHFKSSKEIKTESISSGARSGIGDNVEQMTYSYFLNQLLSNARQNSDRKPGGFRYDPDTRKFAMYLRMIMGSLAYQTLQANLEGAIPSLPSINRYIQSSHYHITEGVLRTEELRNYLNERSLPNVVCLSEDATRVVGRVQYDSRTNQVIGFTLPIHGESGLPIPFKFPARTATEILNHFKTGSVSTNLIVVMAQPVEKKASPFYLLLFGSDSKYSAIDVKHRWIYIKNELAKVGISVLTISSDSEPRYNAVMRDLSQLGVASSIKWFSCGKNILNPFYVQDIIHLITKLRNLILRTKWLNKKLPFGKFKIDMLHVYVLLYMYSKGEHQLTESVLNPADRQNFSSAERMCNERVTALLDFGVENSEATSLYLKMMRDIMSAYMDPNLTPLQRIRRLWYAVFVFRIWRRYIENHKEFTLKDNFLSLNCYACIELNAHSLVLLMVHLKETNQPQLFLPNLFESQQCESTFRQFRSLSSTYSTVVNCTLKEAAARISKIQLQNDIMHGTSEHFVFPRLKKKSEFVEYNHFDLPSKDEIYSEIENCQKDAIKTAKEFGLIGKRSAKTFECKINPHETKHTQAKRSDPILNVRKNIAELDLNNIKLKDYTGKLKDTNFDLTSPYVEILSDDGEQTIVKKTSLCWLLREDCHKLSSDRLLRVRHPTKKLRTQPNKNFKSKISKRPRKPTKKKMK